MLDPRKDAVLIQPTAQQPGYGVGAPSVLALEKDATALVLRVDEPARAGCKVCIVEAPNGSRYRAEDTWWTRRKDVRDPRDPSARVPALGRFCLRRHPIAEPRRPAFSLYTSSRRQPDGRWCIGVVEANSLASFPAEEARLVVMPEDLGVAGVRDPWVLEQDGFLYLYAACELVAGGPTTTVLLVSGDGGAGWTPAGRGIPSAGPAWPTPRARITSVVAGRGSASGRWLAFIDAADSAADDAPGHVRLAISDDNRRTWSIVTHVPAQLGPHADGTPYEFVSPWGDGTVQYVDVIARQGDVRLIYECAMRRGGHAILQATIVRPRFDELVAAMS